VAVVGLAGVWLTREARAFSAVGWMVIYDAADFPTLGSLAAFLRDLRIPVPPYLAVLEVVEHQLTGGLELTTVLAYRLAIVLAYLLPLLWSAGSALRLAASAGLGLVFLAATVLVHPGNPQTYDIFYPLFVLAFGLALRRAARPAGSRAGWALAAGFLLAMAELSRPFVVLGLPLVVALAALAVARRPRQHLAALLLPVLLLSGGWHGWLAVRHGQLASTNHAGQNLRRAWPMAVVPRPPLVPEVNSERLGPGRWPNLNTAEHLENSRRLQRAVLRYVRTHPLGSARHALGRLRALLLDVRTDIYRHRPRHWVLVLYRPLVRAAVAWLTLNALLLVSGLLVDGRRRRRLLADPDSILIVITAFSACALAVGDAQEEARFLISLLPLLAAVPSAPARTYLPLAFAALGRGVGLAAPRAAR
jgi:hypothetical protein